MTPAEERRAEAMARAAIRNYDKCSEDIRKSYILNFAEDAAALDAYFSHTVLVDPEGISSGGWPMERRYRFKVEPLEEEPKRG